VPLNLEMAGGGNEMQGAIRVTRRRAPWRDALRSYVVLIDGKRAGKIRQGATKDFLVQPGRHSLRLKIDWKGSDELTVEVQQDKTASFVCEPGGSALTAAMDVARSSKAYIALYAA
jgi:hypothetical protein